MNVDLVASEGVLRVADAITRPTEPGESPIDKVTGLVSGLSLMVTLHPSAKICDFSAI